MESYTEVRLGIVLYVHEVYEVVGTLSDVHDFEYSGNIVVGTWLSALLARINCFFNRRSLFLSSIVIVRPAHGHCL